MKAQEIFDKVARHLLTQRRKATNPDMTGCRYRTPEGLTCAAGCLIPADKYNELFELKNPSKVSSHQRARVGAAHDD